jgi:calcineurin-like phosphoesterase family protein
MNTWLISDTHFGHRNILTFKTFDGSPLRNFNNIDHHNETLIENWNNTVSDEDKVYHLGDFSICKWAIADSILKRLKGRKVLIKGNHDTFKLSQYAQHFADVRAYHILDGILLAHIPIHPESLSRWKGQVHGHTHSNHMKEKFYMNISVEQTNYTPINFEEVKKYFDTHGRHRTNDVLEREPL